MATRKRPNRADALGREAIRRQREMDRDVEAVLRKHPEPSAERQLRHHLREVRRLGRELGLSDAQLAEMVETGMHPRAGVSERMRDLLRLCAKQARREGLGKEDAARHLEAFVEGAGWRAHNLKHGASKSMRRFVDDLETDKKMLDAPTVKLEYDAEGDRWHVRIGERITVGDVTRERVRPRRGRDGIDLDDVQRAARRLLRRVGRPLRRREVAMIVAGRGVPVTKGGSPDFGREPKG